jgi:hypothetical protein
MLNDKKLDTLIHNDAYYEFLDFIYASREELIQQLHEAGSDKIQQISGRILQCDDILAWGGYHKVVKSRSPISN